MKLLNRTVDGLAEKRGAKGRGKQFVKLRDGVVQDYQ
jgi:hypothetical protein